MAVGFWIHPQGEPYNEKSPHAKVLTADELRFMALSRLKVQVRNRLKDPDSAEFSNLVVYQQKAAPRDTVFGYTLCGEVNAKNSFGGYGGYQKFVADMMLYQSGRDPGDDVKFTSFEDDGVFASMTARQCRDNYEIEGK